MTDLGSLGGIDNSTIAAIVAHFGNVTAASRATGIPRSTLFDRIQSQAGEMSPALQARVDVALAGFDQPILDRLQLIQGNLVNFTQAERSIALVDYQLFPDSLDQSVEQAAELVDRRGRTLPEWAIRGS